MEDACNVRGIVIVSNRMKIEKKRLASRWRKYEAGGRAQAQGKWLQWALDAKTRPPRPSSLSHRPC